MLWRGGCKSFYVEGATKEKGTGGNQIRSMTWTHGPCIGGRDSMNERVLLVGKGYSRKLIKRGAEAVVLFGSWVRGDAYEESDIDIGAIGEGPDYRLEQYKGFLVSVSWMNEEQHRQDFRDPGKVGGIIPAWRNAFIVYDPKGVARRLQEEAIRWQWQHIERQTDRWVAEEITGWAEEVHRLVGNFKLGRRSAAAVQRSALAMKIPPIMAAHLRILYETENRLWDLVSARMGEEWAHFQRAALGEGDQSFRDTCKASLWLYVMAARQVEDLLDRRQRQVVSSACKIAGESID